MVNIIDIELGKKLVNGDEARAKMMLQMLHEALEEHEKIITQARQKNDLEALKNELHKLRGGASYCGTPALQEAASAFETAVRAGDNSETAYQGLTQAITHFRSAYKAL